MNMSHISWLKGSRLSSCSVHKDSIHIAIVYEHLPQHQTGDLLKGFSQCGITEGDPGAGFSVTLKNLPGLFLVYTVVFRFFH